MPQKYRAHAPFTIDSLLPDCQPTAPLGLGLPHRVGTRRAAALCVTALLCLTTLACGGSAKPAGSADESEAYESAPEESAPADATQDPAAEPGAENQFQLNDSDSAGSAQGATASKIKPTATEAAMKFIVVDKDKGPLVGIVISLSSPDGKKYYTQETDSTGYAEVLVPVGKKYDLTYLSLGRRDISAQVPVTDEPNQNIKLTLRYKNNIPERTVKKSGGGQGLEPVFVLKGVTFDTGKATIKPESFPRLDGVVEFMTYKKSARIQISGHTDNVGVPAANKKLSQQRADSCRDYLVKKGVEKSRIDAVGYGDEQPLSSNTTEEGRQENRRIEAHEL